MKDKPKLYGPETPNYQLLNEQAQQQAQRASKPRKGKQSNKGQSQPDDKKPE